MLAADLQSRSSGNRSHINWKGGCSSSTTAGGKSIYLCRVNVINNVSTGEGEQWDVSLRPEPGDSSGLIPCHPVLRGVCVSWHGSHTVFAVQYLISESSKSFPQPCAMIVRLWKCMLAKLSHESVCPLLVRLDDDGGFRWDLTASARTAEHKRPERRVIWCACKFIRILPNRKFRLTFHSIHLSEDHVAKIWSCLE